jgi:hypothetical protein
MAQFLVNGTAVLHHHVSAVDLSTGANLGEIKKGDIISYAVVPPTAGTSFVCSLFKSRQDGGTISMSVYISY